MRSPMGAGDVRSLTIDFQGLPRGSLHALRDLYHRSMSSQEIYYLSSLKLHGDLSTSPEFVAIVSGLAELRLSSTTMAQDLLSALNAMPFLLYLTLITDEIEGISIKVGAFQSLRRLRIVVQHENPVLPEIEEEALPELVSLQLPCKHLGGPSGIEIRHLRKLQEIELHPKISEPARQEWEVVARNHPNRPNILPFINADDQVCNEPTNNNPVASSEESGHEEVVQGQLAEKAPEPSSVQHMPLSICHNSRVACEMDDSAHHEPIENPIGPEDAVLETIINEQPLLEEPLEHTPMQTRHENCSVQSRPTDILGSTCNHSGLRAERDDPRESESPGKPVALEVSTYKTGIQGWPAKKASEYSPVLTDQQGNYTSTELGPTGCCHTSIELLNTSNSTRQIHANGDVNNESL
uniref:Disease resistance R13L4/SHOC-2-like LRR domain-containing protein n=1 Tax=Arundo donax TaxID=35708 RepID=A0A0A9ASD7_ARUDO